VEDPLPNGGAAAIPDPVIRERGNLNKEENLPPVRCPRIKVKRGGE
jgi:hypothetical protein